MIGEEASKPTRMRVTDQNEISPFFSYFFIADVPLKARQSNKVSIKHVGGQWRP